MSKTVTDLEEYKSLDQIKKEMLSLKRENQAAMKTIEKLLKDLSKKNEEISHLQSLVSQAVPVKVPDKKKISVEISAEEEIAMIQLNKLRQVAQSRALTLEETKIFDLLVKNKRLSQDESTVNMSKASYRDVSEIDLLQIASASDESTDKNK